MKRILTVVLACWVNCASFVLADQSPPGSQNTGAARETQQADCKQLLKAAQDNGASVAIRQQAVALLVANCENKRSVMEVLAGLYEHTTGSLHESVYEALRNSDGSFEFAVKPLVKIYNRSTDTEIKNGILNLFSHFPEYSADTMPVFLDALSQADTLGTALFSVSKMGTRGDAATSRLISLAEDQHQAEQLRFLAASALVKIVTNPATKSSVFLVLLKDRDEKLRHLAETVFQSKRELAIQAVAPLLNSFREGNARKKILSQIFLGNWAPMLGSRSLT